MICTVRTLRIRKFFNVNKLKVEEALLLVQLSHGDFFSMKLWKAFLRERRIQTAPLSWNDLRVFLCTIPDEKSLEDPEPEIKKLKLNLEKDEIEQERFLFVECFECIIGSMLHSLYSTDYTAISILIEL